MRILYVGSKAQQCAGIVFALDKMGYEVACYPKSAEEVESSEEEQQALEIFLKKQRVTFVLSNLFGESVAGMTNRIDMKYAVWCMDSPAFQAWTPAAALDNCYVFYFDYREYELKKQSGLKNVYHLPLAADIIWSDQLAVTDEEIRKYRCDMSFIGSLYTQNLYDKTIEQFPADMQESFTELIENSAFVWDGQDRLHMPQELVRAARKLCPGMFDEPHMPDEYFLRKYFMGRKLTHVERTLMVELLAGRYDINLYTRDTEIVPEGVRRFPEIDGSDGALKVFRASRINLNITLRSIASGVPLRVFDVMGMGGFMLSNWQEEIPDLFDEGEEIVTYKSPEELIDKADYYLKHEDERAKIAVNGYRKVKAQHTYEHRLEKIISILYPTP